MNDGDLQGSLNRACECLDEAVEDAERLREYVDGDESIALKELAVAYFRIRDMYEAIDAKVKRLYHVMDHFNKRVLPERIRAAGIDLVRVPEIGRSFSPVEKISASLIDKEAAFEWLRANGHGDLIQETVNAGTLASFCRNMILEEGVDPPADLVKISTYYTTSVNKYRPKTSISERI